MHLLQFIADEGYRRMIGTQLNVQEARHRLDGRSPTATGASCASATAKVEDQLGSHR
ncbi:Tn3 family transposase [Nonomuraea wenchangensis]